MEDHWWYRVPENIDDLSLAAIVADDYSLKAEGAADSVVTFFDTFDWRLYNRSLALCQSGDVLTLRRLPAGVVLQTLAGEQAPDFAWRLGDGPLKGKVAPLAGIRRLFPVGKASVRTLPYRILNADDKTVARLLAVEVRAAGGAGADLLDTAVELLPVRGYDGHFRRLAGRLEKAGFLAACWQETFERILAAAGRQPGSYSAKPDYQLQPAMRADAAMKEILWRTLAVLRANEAGIKADWDLAFWSRSWPANSRL